MEINDLEGLIDLLPQMSQHEKQVLLAELCQLDDMKLKELAKDNFLEFVKVMWPEFISGRHHAKMAEKFEGIASGKYKRVIISMPPRHTKSEFASYLFPAWILGRDPSKKIIQASHTADLAVRFGRKLRNLVDSELFQTIFPATQLRADSKAAGRWDTNSGGEYFATGVGGAVTGRGADLLIIDDPVSEQDAQLAESNPAVFDRIYEWYTSGPRQRLQPGGTIAIIMTRWSKRDLVGRVLKDQLERGGDEWEYLEFPAILPSGLPLWPEFWKLEELEALKKSLPLPKWQAQYQQNPISDNAAIIKREWWMTWEGNEPPECGYVLQAWDTAFEAHNRADYSACTTWGVFYKANSDGVKQANIILLNAMRERMEFPRLKQMAMQQYKDWRPDSLIVEKKASGAPLISELRRMGVLAQEFTPTRGNDKIARLNAISDIISSGRVWIPNRRWADEVVEEVAEFPAGDNDDYVDTVSMALMRFRKGGFITTDLDEEPEDMQKRRYDYY